MKKITLFLLLSMVIVFSAEAHKYKHKNKHAQVTISIQTFYDQLSPYGDWIYTQDNGYVWRPYFEYPEAFRPYSSNGNWVYTDYGWTWASDYRWGWAAFHYGRWDFDNYLGWMWIPGYDWAPAWVTWGSYNNYWGWAPMGPNIYVQTNWYAPDPWWTFVPQNQFCSSNWNHYIYNRPVHVTNITHITNVYVDGNDHNNYSKNNSWYNGPRVNDVEKYSRSKVARMEVSESQRPEKSGVHNNRLDVYRPNVETKRNNSRPAEYRNVEQARTDKRIEQSNARTNNPGVNSTRKSRSEVQNTNQATVQRNANTKSETRIEPRPSTQIPGSGTKEVARNPRETSRTTTPPEKRSTSVNKETTVQAHTKTQGTTQTNSPRTTAEPKRETTDRKARLDVTEGSHPVANTNRIENKGNSQPRNISTSHENTSTNSSRESGTRESTANQRKPEQRMQSDARASSPKQQNVERKESPKEGVNPAESKKTGESSGKRSSANPVPR
jgi:hypothetical protein